jgi:hypothetical protein
LEVGDDYTILDNATISLAILTGLLFIATTAAVIVSALAARSTAEIVRLESEPVITIRAIDTRDEDSVLGSRIPRDYVVGGDLSKLDGLDMREMLEGESTIGKSGMKRPSILLELQNVGRSPALELAILFDLQAANMDHDRFNPDRDGSRDDGDGWISGTGSASVLGIAPQALSYLRIFHDFGIWVKVNPQRIGAISKPHRLNDDEPQPVTIVSEGPFLIKDPTWYENLKRASVARDITNAT